jgi:hypothetical protein
MKERVGSRGDAGAQRESRLGSGARRRRRSQAGDGRGLQTARPVRRRSELALSLAERGRLFGRNQDVLSPRRQERQERAEGRGQRAAAPRTLALFASRSTALRAGLARDIILFPTRTYACPPERTGKVFQWWRVSSAATLLLGLGRSLVFRGGCLPRGIG